MPKRLYVLALACYLSIPVVVIGGGRFVVRIDPEMARGHAGYALNFWLLSLVRRGAMMATAGLTLALWLSTCFLALKSRQRSPGWLALAAAGPFGFSAIAMLEDRSPAPDDRYQRFIGTLKTYWRVPLELALCFSVWTLAYDSMVLKRDLMIRYESFSTGTPVATIIATQNASSGMWAFGEGLEVAYLVALIYLLWPIVFNLAALCWSGILTILRSVFKERP
jgi:hypothetical protein